MVAAKNTVPCSVDLYLCGLQCEKDPGCRAFVDTENGGMKAVCSETPGRLQPSPLYIIHREVWIQGNCFNLRLPFSNNSHTEERL